MAKRKRDDGVRLSGHKKSRASLSLHALRQAVGLSLGSGRPSSVQDVPLAPSAIKAHAADAIVGVTLAPPLPFVVFVHEVALVAVEVSVPVGLAGSAMVPSSTVVAPLLSVDVATTSANVLPPPSFSGPRVPRSTALASTSTSSHPMFPWITSTLPMMLIPCGA